MPAKWKLLLIAFVTIPAAVLLWPPGETIPLGLDLAGGIHLLVKVETDDSVQAALDGGAIRAQEALEKAGVEHDPPETSLSVEESTYQVMIGAVAPAKMEQASKVVTAALREYDVEELGGVIVASLNAAQVDVVRDTTTEQALNTISERINVYGVSEPIIQRQGHRGERILVQLPGVDDPDRVKKLIGKVAFLEIKLVDAGPFSSPQEARDAKGGTLPNHLEVVQGLDQAGLTIWYVVERVPVVTGRDLMQASADRDEYGMPAVSFRLNADGARRFGEVSGRNIGRQLAIILDESVKSAPVLRSRISDSGQINGLDDLEESRDLSLVLKAGALPAKITYLEERAVGPALGRESITAGIWAALIGLAMVMSFMLIYYKLSGINAVVALVLNILLMLGALAGLRATLTLPGIAGFILTIGMAVDANVIIFERIREDLLAGKTVRSAVEGGFAKAFWTIFDANITTLIAALFLIQFGTGPIRGFAVTLSLGIVASMFTAIFVSKTIFEVFVFRGGRTPARLSI